MSEELTEDQKQKIEAEEQFRSQVREKLTEKPEYYAPAPQRRQSGCSGCAKVLLIPPILGIIIVAIMSATNPRAQLEKARILRESQQIENILPVKEIMKKTELQIRADYSNFISNYSEGTLTASKKVKITGFDIGEKGPDVQIDYSVKSGKPIYVSYSFSRVVNASMVYYPKSENIAWQTTGFTKPTAAPTKDTKSIDGKTRHVDWENTTGIEPFKYIGVNLNQEGLVTKIFFSLEGLNYGPDSLYYVPI